MNTHRKLWKVVITHKMGSHAPSYFVETEYAIVKSKTTRENKEVEELKALKEARKRTRLSDFPEKWRIEVLDTEKYWDNNKQRWMKHQTS